jgi:ABC-type molybdate transport system substrate-binding protein
LQSRASPKGFTKALASRRPSFKHGVSTHISMVLVVPKDSKAIDSFADLADQSVEQVALGELTTVPAGEYAEEILTNLDIIDAVKTKAI